MRPVQELTAETITHPRIVRMHDYWSSKCAGRTMPSRSDVDALELRDCLGNLCLIEVTDDTPRRFRFRIDGSKLASVTGFDMTGKFVDQIPEPVYREFVCALYERVVLTREPVFLANHEEWEGYGIEVVSATLPLSTYGFRVDGILDAVFPVRSLD